MNQNRMPIIEMLERHYKKQSISFHVPGHKNGLLFTDENFAEFTHYDVTEITGLDDLHEPEGEIAEAEHLLADVYQTKKSYFLVNGSTVGNLSMILATCKENDYVLVQRNCHKSILHGLMLAKVRPIFIAPILVDGREAGIDLKDVICAFKQYKQIRACILTYPDYYGRTYDLQTIIEYAHTQNSIVLVDEAHGPHFKLSQFPTSALTLGADIVVHSAHKMLPAMTMGSYLHINSERVNQQKVKQYLSMLQSSSPSYPLMGSLDYARHYIAHFTKEDLEYTFLCRQQFIEDMKERTELQIVPQEVGQDALKLLVYHPSVDGFTLQSMLEDVQVYPELAAPDYVLFTLPLLKVGMEFPYERAIEKLKKIIFPTEACVKSMHHYVGIQPLTELGVSYKEMEELESEVVSIKEAGGRIAAQMVIPYPPGIPLFLTGERITEHHITTLEYLLKHRARFQGGELLGEGNVVVYKL